MVDISVIIPVYNAESYIGDCIECIIKQYYKNFELILVDDGSTDKSFEICSKYASLNPMIRVVRKENGGVSSARNRGIYEAKGTYLCFIDADDQITENYLENLMQSNVDIVVSGLSFVSVAGELSHNIPIAFESNIRSQIGTCIPNLEKLILLNGPYQKRYKKNIIEKYEIRFDETCSSGEDTLFVLTYMCYIQSIKVIPISDYYYFRRENNSLSQKRSPYLVAYNFAIQMYKLRKKIISEFQIVDKQYINNVEIIYQNYLFVSLYTLYYQEIDKTERLFFIKKIYNDNKNISLFFSRSAPVRNMVSVMLLKMNNLYISDYFYQLMFKFIR